MTKFKDLIFLKKKELLIRRRKVTTESDTMEWQFYYRKVRDSLIIN